MYDKIISNIDLFPNRFLKIPEWGDIVMLIGAKYYADSWNARYHSYSFKENLCENGNIMNNA